MILTYRYRKYRHGKAFRLFANAHITAMGLRSKEKLARCPTAALGQAAIVARRVPDLSPARLGAERATTQTAVYDPRD